MSTKNDIPRISIREQQEQLRRAQLVTSIIVIIACVVTLVAFVSIACGSAMDIDIFPWIVTAIISGGTATIGLIFALPVLMIAEMDNEINF